MAIQTKDQEEEDLLDDSFEDLPVDALDALEQYAIRSTQRQNLDLRSLPYSSRPPEALRSASASSNALVLPPQSNGIVPSPSQQIQATRFDHQPLSNNGDIESGNYDVPPIDMADPEVKAKTLQETASTYVPGEMTQREQWRMKRYGKSDTLSPKAGRDELRSKHGGPGFRTAQELARERACEIDMQMKDVPEQSARNHEVDDGTAHYLQAQVQELLRDRQTLQQSLAAANMTVMSKAGETAIVRANLAKSAKENDRRITALQSMHADEFARQKADLDRAIAERERVNTDNSFLKQELTEEVEKVKALKRNSKAGENGVAKGVSTEEGLNVTPRKLKSLSYRDGFDDDEIFASPSRTIASRSSGGTPRGRSKRKRKTVDDSPAPPLQLSQITVDATAHLTGPSLSEALLQRIGREDGKFEFLQSVINHRQRQSEPRSMEAFTKHFLPSNPDLSIAAVLLDRFGLDSAEKSKQELPSHFCDGLVSIWVDCLKEEHYAPLELILDFLSHMLTVDANSTAPHLIDTLLPLLQSTSDINVVPTFQRQPTISLNPSICVPKLLSLLHLVALSCTHNPSDIRRFWRFMRFDFVLMVVYPVQPLADILTMLDILRTSILPATFGPIVSSVSASTSTSAATMITPVNPQQAKNERYVLERLTALLTETPRHPPPLSTPRYPAHTLSSLRLSVLSVLSSLSKTAHGLQALAIHPSAIARLVKILHDEMDALYDHRYGHELSASMINTSTRILHSIMTSDEAKEGVGDLQGKLTGGGLGGAGVHKHIVGLTRLAFSGGEILEKGIDDEVVEMAHRLLEEAVTPEEGEALLGAFTSDD